MIVIHKQQNAEKWANWTHCGINSGGWNGRSSARFNKPCTMTTDWDKVTCKRCLKGKPVV